MAESYKNEYYQVSAAPRDKLNVEEEEDEGLPLRYRILMAIVGVFEVSNGGNRKTSSREKGLVNRCRKTVWASIVVFLCLLNLFSFAALLLYIICYFAKDDHYLRFLSHLCYRPSLVSVQIIALLATLKNAFQTPNTRSWRNAFYSIPVANNLNLLQKTDRKNRSKRWISFIVFMTVPSVHLFLKMMYIKHMHSECLGWVEIMWIASEMVGAYFFALFWYYIYLQRMGLEQAKERSVRYIYEHSGHCDDCITEIRRFFHEYYPLRSFTRPWMYVLLFTSTFGLAIVFNWNYNKDTQLSLTTSTPVTLTLEMKELTSLRQQVCTYTCDTRNFMHTDHVFLWYNVWIVWRHAMTFLLPYLSTSRMDIKHTWSDFQTDLYLMYTKENDWNWTRLNKYVADLHPESSSDTMLTFMIPVIALVSGILSGETSNF